MQTLLAIAEELEGRDAEIAGRLDDVEARQHEVDDVRRALGEAELAIRRLPELRRAQEADEAAAFDARAQAVTAVREAEERLSHSRESGRASAERQLDDARAALDGVEREAEHLVRRREALHEQERSALDQVAAAASRALSLGAETDVTGAPDEVIPLVAEWAERERGALLLEHSNLASERDIVVREASELLASALGDASALTSVAGLRARLERALPS